MKIEVGKSYRTRDGDIEKIAHIDATHPFASTNPFIAESGRSYREDGCYMQDGQICGADIVAEIDGGGEGVVETGGCAPPVLTATFSDEPLSPKMAERIEPVEIRPVVHDDAIDAEFNPDAGRRISAAEAERAINPPVFIDLTAGAVNAAGAPPPPPPMPSARQLASALRLLVREADRYSDYADNSLQLTDAIILAESVLDRLAP